MKQSISDRKRNLIIAISLGVFTIALSLALYLGGVYLQPLARVRALAETILRNTYNPLNTTLTSYSLNAVSAVIWDYRGVDTVFETTVLLASIIGITHLLNTTKWVDKGVKNQTSLVAKFSTRLIVVITTLIAISTAVHGHLTPGGGFQAGAMLTVIIALIVPVFSINFIYMHGLRKDKMLYSRYFILLLITLTALSPVLLTPLIGNAYIMQNQVKEDSSFSMPAWFMDTPLGGSIFFYNVLEAFAIALALSYALLLLLEYRTE
ncbi:MAG: MnhB domain-containing protein [Desulfurococcaceae archaeon]